MFEVCIVKFNIGEKGSFCVGFWAYVDDRSFVGCFTLKMEIELSLYTKKLTCLHFLSAGSQQVRSILKSVSTIFSSGVSSSTVPFTAPSPLASPVSLREQVKSQKRPFCVVTVMLPVL